MKYFEPTYLILLSSSMINWLLSAKDIISGITALVLGLMTIVYMWFKIKDMMLSFKLKQRQLKDGNSSNK
jgi:hypothetical protein